MKKKRETVVAHTVTPGKKPVRIDRARYDTIYAAIVRALSTVEALPFRDLPEAVARYLPPTFEGSVSWYTTTVKLDMERRGVIERLPGVKPQKLRLVRRRT